VKYCKKLKLSVFSIFFLILFPIMSHAAYKEIDVSKGGTIRGKVLFRGELPHNAMEKISISKNPEVCGEGFREVMWIDVRNGALRGTFVFLDKVREGKKWPAPEKANYMVDQKNCRFIPWAQVVKRGPLIVRNSDNILHNINMREMIGVEKKGRKPVKRSLFNFGQPEMGDIEKMIKGGRSPYLSVNCEAHNFMFGFMLAPEHPYAVVVNDEGSYAIDNVPPGEYTLKAWHPRLGVKKVEITVPAEGRVESNFEFSKQEK